jgi:hypothetical protein
MTSTQRTLYRAALRIGRAFGTGGSAWTGRRATGGTPATAPTISTLSSRTIAFLENGMVKQMTAQPAVPIFASPYWGVAAIDVDILVNDVYTNGTIAFIVTGQPDTSQGFQLIPADLTQVPA